MLPSPGMVHFCERRAFTAAKHGLAQAPEASTLETSAMSPAKRLQAAFMGATCVLVHRVSPGLVYSVVLIVPTNLLPDLTFFVPTFSVYPALAHVPCWRPGVMRTAKRTMNLDTFDSPHCPFSIL